MSSEEILRLLEPDGRLHGRPAMERDQVHEALSLMLQSRALDELAIKLQRLKRIGLYAPVLGQEAAVVGSALALDRERDWMVPAAREQPAMLCHGLPLANLLALYMGRFEFAGIPAGVRLLQRQQAIGAQLPQAAGLAWSLKLRGERAATLVYCGDGASSEGDFHEALNLAGVLELPLVVVLINNRYAISTPIHKQTAATNLAVRAAGYGFPGFAVDGNDVFAVHAVCSAAVERALAGKGPTLIECRTYRIGFHNTSDNPNDYRDAAEVEEARAGDPLARLIRYVVDCGLMTEVEVEALKANLVAELEAVQRTVYGLPRPGASYIFDHIYADPPMRLLEQRQEALEGS